MDIGSLDKRTSLAILAIAVMAGLLIIRSVGSSPSSAPVSAGSAPSIPIAEQRLKHLRDLASTVPAKEDLANKAKTELADREKGMLVAADEQQAQAKLLELTQKIARANQIDVRGMQQFGNKLLSTDYAEISANVQFNCGVEQLVNFLSALGTQPQILGTNDIRISGGNDAKKNLQVHLSVTAVVPRSLIPKKGGTKL